MVGSTENYDIQYANVGFTTKRCNCICLFHNYSWKNKKVHVE